MGILKGPTTLPEAEVQKYWAPRRRVATEFCAVAPVSVRPL